MEYERFAGGRRTGSRLGPCRWLALPVLTVCDTGRASESFLAAAGDPPLLARP